MTKPDLILIGAGGHAHSCIDVILENGTYNLAGLVGLPAQKNSNRLGYTVFASDNELEELARIYRYGLIAVGQILTSANRIRLFKEATKLGFEMVVIVSPKTHVSRFATIGAGTIVMHGAVINAGVKIGENCIINTGSLIDHDVIVGDHCHISTGAILNGNVTIGAGTFIGSGCVIKEGVSVGNNCITGMGLSIRKNLLDNARFIGFTKS